MKSTMLLVLIFMTTPLLLSAHGIGSSGIVSGFTYPILGFDHLFAILAVGISSSLFESKVSNTQIIVFVLAMFLGGISGVLGFNFSMMETGIALSTVLFGVLILLNDRISFAIALFLIGIFAWMHGLAHGIEMNQDFHIVPYFIRFLIAALALLLLSRFIGRLILKKGNHIILNMLGGGLILSVYSFCLNKS